MIMTRRKTWHKWVIAAVACWLGLSTALATEPDWKVATAQLRTLGLSGEAVDSLIAQARQRSVSPATVLEWRATLAQAQKAGVPPGLMGERIGEGLAKGVPADRITQALGTLQNNLAWARQVVEAHVAKAELRAKPVVLESALRQMDAALRAGLARAQIAQIFDKTQLTLEQCAALARTAADLRGFGVEATQLVRVMQSAGRAGLTAAEIDRLERKFVQGHGAGRALPDLLAEFELSVKELREHSRPGHDELRQEMKHDSTQDGRGAPAGGGSMQDMGGPSGPRDY